MGRKASTTAPERDHDLCWRIPPAFVESVVNNNIQLSYNNVQNT